MRKVIHENGLSIQEVAKLVGGRIVGSQDCSIHGLCAFDQPQAGHLSMLLKGQLKLKLDKLKPGLLAALLVKEDLLEKLPDAVSKSISLIVVPNPQKAMVKLIPKFFEPYPVEEGVSPKADVHSSAEIGQGVSIHAFCSVGAGAKIGDKTVLYPHVTIYPGVEIGPECTIHSGAVIREDCKIGPRSVIQNGAVIGADGFGYLVDEKLGLIAFPQVGIVQSAPMVDIGANACIDRGALGDTTLGAQTKVDNLVQVGHNTKIGQGSILCGQVGVSGSCTIGNQVILGGGTGLVDHMTIPDGCRLGARTGVVSSIPEKGDYAGWPAMPGNQWLRRLKLLEKLPDLDRKVRKLWKMNAKDEEI
jgi:UDP-3-O-[3-hydroxymyristoyl] glucosamine N-acyltransferase